MQTQFSPALTVPALFTSYAIRYQEAFAAAQPWWPKIAMEMPSTGRANVYTWMSRLPKVREWLGERVLQNAEARAVAIANRDFELTIEIDRNDILDDQLGQFNPIVDSIGAQMRKWPDDLIVDVLRNGNDATKYRGYDNKAFWAVDHPVKGVAGAQANLFPSTPLTADNYNLLRTKMFGYVGEDGRPLTVNPRLIIVPPQLEITAKQILHGSSILQVVTGSGGGAGTNAVTAIPNQYQGTAEVFVINELAVDPTTWYMVDVNQSGIKPFIFQNRQNPIFVRKDSPTDDNLFWRKKYVMGADARGNGAPALWFLAAKAIG